MTDPEFTCPEGREASELLAYVEGELDASSRGNLEEHLRFCRPCSGQVALLRRTILLLKDYSESLHPSEAELYRFVSSGKDADGRIASHVAWCEDCREDLQMVEEMLSLRKESPGHRQLMPQALIRRLEYEVHPLRKGGPNPLKSLSTFFRRFLSQPFRLPALALGTAAAVLIAAVVSVPMWRAYKESGPPLWFAPPHKEVHTGKVEEPRAPQEKSTADEFRPDLESLEDGNRDFGAPRKRKSHRPSSLPAPVTKGTLDKEEPAPRSPAAAAPNYYERPSGVGDRVPTEGLQEAKQSKESLRRRETVKFRRAVRPKRLSKPEPGPEATLKGLVKTKVSPAVSQQGERESPSDTSAVSMGESHRKPVRIRIVDRDGRAISWLRFEPPKDLGYVLRFDDAEEPVHEVSSRPENAPGTVEPQSLGGRAADESLVLVSVDTSRNLYDVTAELFEAGSNRPIKTIEAFGVSRRDLEKRLKSIVSSLLGKR